MKGLLNTLSGGFIFSIGQSHTKLSRVWMASLSFFSRGFEKGTSLSSLLNLLTNFPEGRNGVQSIQFTIQRTFTNRLSS